MDWGKLVLKPWIESQMNGRPWLLFLDSLKCQRKPEWIRFIASLKGTCVWGPPGCTEIWQPIDSGHLGAICKHLAKDQFERYMDSDSTKDFGCKL